MPQSIETSVRIAVLTEPRFFGLSKADVNPMLLYLLRKDEPKYSEQGVIELWKLCFDAVNATLHEKVVEFFGAVNKCQGELEQIAVAGATESQPQEQQSAPAKSTAKNRGTSKAGQGAQRNANNGDRGDKLTVKQLRYLGYLIRKLGEEPDYKDISTLTQGQATMRIKELEQRVNE